MKRLIEKAADSGRGSYDFNRCRLQFIVPGPPKFCTGENFKISFAQPVSMGLGFVVADIGYATSGNRCLADVRAETTTNVFPYTK